jgi:hypothetical protein
VGISRRQKIRLSPLLFQNPWLPQYGEQVEDQRSQSTHILATIAGLKRMRTQNSMRGC